MQPIEGMTHKQNTIVADVVVAMAQVAGVQAVALGGSFARGTATPTSDIDLGLYYIDNAPFAIADIQSIAEQFDDDPAVTVTDFGDWGRWVDGGAWLTIAGQRVDLIYRSLDRLQHWITESKHGVIALDYYQQPVTGFYSYMYLAELAICVPLDDKQGQLAHLKAQVADYPPQLAVKIMQDFASMARFVLYHAKVAAQRDDTYALVGCLHRIVACVVQIIYAQNKQYFISDKGAIAACTTFERIPSDFEARIIRIVTHPTTASVVLLEQLLDEIIA